MLEEGPSSASTRESGLGRVLTSPAAGVEPPPPKLEPMLVCFLRGGEMPPVWSPPPSALFITKCLGLQQSWLEVGKSQEQFAVPGHFGPGFLKCTKFAREKARSLLDQASCSRGVLSGAFSTVRSRLRLPPAARLRLCIPVAGL